MSHPFDVDAADDVLDGRLLEGEVAQGIALRDLGDELGGGCGVAAEPQPLTRAVDLDDLGRGDGDRRGGLGEIDDERALLAVLVPPS